MTQDIYTFDTDIGRYYQVGNNAYPSVSTVIANTKSSKEKAILSRWRKRVGYKQANIITQAACNRGTLLHQCVEALIDGDLNKFNNIGNNENVIDFITPSVNVFANIAKCKSIGKEEIVYNEALRYAGRYDYYAYSPRNKRVLFDWKTASQKKYLEYCNNYFLQLTAYSEAIKERTGEPPEELAVIVFYENTSADIYTINVNESQYDDYRQEFTARLSQFHEMTSSTIAMAM